MKKKNVLLWLCTLCFPLGSMAQGFIHPGALHTQADFDRVKEKLANGEEPWTAAYKFFKTSPYIMTVDDRHPTPVRRIVRGYPQEKTRITMEHHRIMRTRPINSHSNGRLPGMKNMPEKPSST